VNTLSTHVLDSATGRPATGMIVTLEMAVAIDEVDGSVRRAWLPLADGVTDPDGRLKHWDGAPLGPGHYRLIFNTQAWSDHHGRECFYPEVIITFAVNDDDSHYHVPLLLAPYAYSTYRGS
jgi:5-hydroxyisourate hydrolase